MEHTGVSQRPFLILTIASPGMPKDDRVCAFDSFRYDIDGIDGIWLDSLAQPPQVGIDDSPPVVGMFPEVILRGFGFMIKMTMCNVIEFTAGTGAMAVLVKIAQQVIGRRR